MDVLSLKAILSLDRSDYDKGLADASSKASSFGSAIKSGFGTVAKVGAAALGAATAAVGVFTKSSLKAGMDFDSSMSQVAATMGLSMDEMQEKVGSTTISVNGQVQEFSGNLREFAQVMGENTAFSATEAADALNYMALAGYDVQTSMDMLPNVLNLAAAGSMDLARASDMITDTQTAFGISLERTTLMVDEMAKAASTGNTSVEQLGDAFLTVGGLAQELNGGMVTLADGTKEPVDGVQELEIALTAMANAGVKGSEAGTHMRNMLLKLSSPTKDGVKQLEALGVTVFDDVGNMRSLNDIFGDLNGSLSNLTQEQKIQAISDLFNTRDLASAEALLNAVGQDWDKIGESILGASYDLGDLDNALTGALDWSKYSSNFTVPMDEAMKGLRYDIVYNLVDLGADVADTAEYIANEYDISMEDARKAVESVKEAMESTTGAAQKMADTQLDNLDGDMKLFRSALEGAQIAVSDKLTPSLRDFVQFGTEGLSKITAAFKEGGLSGAMEAFGEILSDGLAMIIGKVPQFVTAGMNLLGALGQGIVDNAPQLFTAFLQIGDRIGEAVMNLMEMSDESLANFDWAGEAAKLADFLTNALTGDGATHFLDTGMSILEGIYNGIAEAFPALATAAVDIVIGLADGIMENLPSIVDAAISMVDSLAEAVVENAPKLGEKAGDIIVKFTEMLTNPSSVTQLFSAAMRIIMGLANGILNCLPKLIDAVPVIIKNLVANITANVPQLVMTGLELIVALATGLIQAIPRLVLAIPAILWALVSGIMEGADQFIDIGVDLVEGLWKGIKQRWSDLVNDFKNLAHNLVDKVKGIFGIHSPSTVFAGIGNNIDKGLAKGIKGGLGEVEKAMDTLSSVPLEYSGDFNISGEAANRAAGATAGNIYITVNGAEGQDETTLGEIVSDRLLHELGMRNAVWNGV